MLALDFVSPLPPVRSGIADYSADLLPELAARCDLRVLRLPGQPVTPQIEQRWRPAPIAHLAEEGRLPLYQMGNNEHHLEVFRAAVDQPGVLTLHDLVLHHFLVERTLAGGDFAAYVAALELDHGLLGRWVAMPRRWDGCGDAAQFALPARRDLLRRQRGILVHSSWAVEHLLEEDPDLRVGRVPMGVPLPPLADRGAGIDFRRRFRLPLGAPLLGSFGFQTPIKRTEVAIAALAQPGLEDVHLLVVGEVSPAVDIEGEARQAGVADRVHVIGYLPFADLSPAIAAVDLCLNLRYPSAGETSASLLRALAVGRGAVVSSYAQFTELPDEVVVKVPLGEGEVESLARRLLMLLEQPERLREMGRAARDYVRREHDPGLAAAAVVSACQEWRLAEPPGPRPNSPTIPTSLTWGRLPGLLEVEGADSPWPRGERRSLRVSLTNTGDARWLAGERGPGGVTVEVQLLAEDDLLAGQPWLPLPVDLEPGETYVFDLQVRCPPGGGTLRIKPHVLGAAGMSLAGGPSWERQI